MKDKFLSKAVPRGTRTIWRYLSALILLFSLSIGQMWAADPVESVGNYSTRVISADGTSSTWTFILPSSQVSVPAAGATDNDIVFAPSSGSNMKFSSSNQFSWKGQSDGYIPVPNGSAGTISMTVKGTSDSRYLQLYVGGSAAADSKRLWSKYNATPTSDGKKGPQSFSFTADDITTEGGKTYLHFRDNNTEMKIATFTVTLTTGNYLSSGPVDPTLTFNDGVYTLGGSDLDLSTLVSASNSDGTITYSVKSDPDDTGASISGTTFIADAPGTVVVTASQAATSSYNAKSVDFNVVVNTPVTPACPAGVSISGTQVYDEGQTISLEATLTEGNGEISYQWYHGSIEADNEVGTNSNVLTIANCAVSDGGNYFCVASKPGCSLDAESSAFAVTVNALVACTELVPATSGDAPAAGDAINLTTATGGSMQALSANLTYTVNGLQFGTNSGTKASVTLNHLMQGTTVIKLTLVANGTGARGLHIYDAAGSNKVVTLGWSNAENGDEATFTYTVTGTDKLNGTNGFQLWRYNTVTLKSLQVLNCGAELFALTSAIYPAEAEGKATITLSKNFVENGGTATATYSAIDAAYDFDEWVINGATIDDAHKNPVTITMGSNPATITLKLKDAGTKYKVTYYDGAEDPTNKLGEELVEEANNPTAAEIVVPHKLGYTFAGWSTTNGGAVVPLNTISVTADMPLFAVFNAVNCSAQSGTIFSVILNKPQAENCTIRSGSGYETEADLIKYGTVSGGIALAKNTSTSNHIVITTDPKLRLLGGNGKVHIQFDCALQAGDKIRTTIENQNIAYTTSDSRSTTNYFEKGTAKELTITKDHVLENASEIYLWSASSNDGRLISLEVIRPEKFEVTFNMHDHGDAVDPQSVVEGGKVTKPTDPTASGWDFGGWFKESTFDNEWDFDNDVVNAATELHAKWTAHTTSSDATLTELTVNGISVILVQDQYTYPVELPMGTTPAEITIDALPNDPNAEVTGIDLPVELPGTAMVTVRAEDGTTLEYYTLNLTVATTRDLLLVFKTNSSACVGTPSTADQILSNNAAVSSYINQITFTNVEGAGDNGAEGSSLNVGKKAGNMFTLTAKPGYAFQAMNFLAKIQDATCEYSIDGSDWTTLASTNTGGDECYQPFSGTEVHEFRLRSTGASGVWIRNMQLTLIEACTPVAITWDEEPVEFEVGKSGYAIAATANNGGTIAYGSSDVSVIAVDAGNGVLSVSDLGSTTLSASTPEGDGTTYCENGGNDIEISKVVSTYFLVKFDAQNGEDPAEVKYHDSDMEVALPATDPSYPGHTFTGWFDAATGGNPVTTAFAPNVSMTIYAHWTVDCDAPTIVEHPESANYFTGRTADALECQATAAGGNALTYKWYSCDDDQKTNPVELQGAPTPNTDVAGTFYFFCAVTEEGCGNVAYSNVAVITVADKDAICLVKAELAPGSSAASITSTSGYYKDDANIAINVGKDLKLGGTGKYVKVAVEGTNFRDGDVVEIALASDKTASAWLQIFADEGTTLVAEMTSGVTREHPNYLTISGVPANTKTLYLYRTEAAGSNMNPYPTSMAVYRACAPILNKVTVAGVEGAPDNTNHVAIEVPNSTLDDALDAIAYDWVSNDAAWTAAHEPAVANAWEWGVENTVTLTDKDQDQSVYYVTISKAAASTDATLSALTVNGQAIALADGVFEYTFELPYGTSVVPTVVATPNHVAAVATVDPCTLSGATITVVPESGADDKQVYTLTFVISKWKEVVIWDGSSMSAVATSPTDEKELRWETVGFGSIANYTTTCGEKTYTKVLPSSGAATGRYMTLTVPAGYVAKFYVVMASHSDGNERGMSIGSNLKKDPDETTVLSLSTSSRDEAVAGMSEIAGAGTWYINPNASIDIQEIRAYLRPGYARTDMLGNGVLGTVCVDHNVAIEDIQGVTVYELVGREPQYGKVAFDEIVTGELEAGAPYVFQAHGDRMVLFYGEDKVDDPVDKGNGMYGTFETIVLTELTDIYYFAQRALWSCVGAEDLTVAANRAYVKLSEIDYLDVNQQNPAPGRRRILMTVNGETQAQGFENLESGDAPVKVMIDGTLYILRGEKVFDATGRLVK